MPNLSLHTSRRVQTMKDGDYDHEIGLVDQDSPSTTRSRSNTDITGDEDLSSSQATPLRNQRVQGEQGRHGSQGGAAATGRSSLDNHQRPEDTQSDQGRNESRLGDRNTAETGPSIEIEGPTPLEPTTQAANGDMARPKSKQREEPESEIDILWENERGCFVCGAALFSGAALGNLDPSPWTNQYKKTSPTNVKTATVPDPSWEWAWPEWRINREEGVAMDEFGWEYSFMFAKKFSWHGPKWWNSFVRRRAWIRKRVKKHRDDLASDPHMLNTDYFNVVPAEHHRPHSSGGGSRYGSRASTHSKASIQSKASIGRFSNAESVLEEKPDIEDTWMLMMVLRASRIDREKIEAVDNYLEHAKDDLERLQDEMHDIMGIFVFQASRRILLSRLTQVYDEMNRVQKDDATFKARRKNLGAAIEHADEEVRRLAYWSDVKGVAENGLAAAKKQSNDGTLAAPRGLELEHLPPMRIAPALQPESMHDAMKRQFLDTLLYDVEEDPKSIEVVTTTGSVMDKGSAVYKSARETGSSQHRQHRAIWQQLRLDEIRKGKGKDTADWRKVLNILANRAPKATLTLSKAARTLVVTQQLADRLLYGTDQTIWDIAERTDCRVDMDESSASASLRPPGKRVVLTGFDYAVKAAKAEIAYVANQVAESSQSTGVTASSAVLSQTPPTTSTSIQKSRPQRSKPRHWTSKRSLGKPGFTSEWTILYKFEDYPRPLYWTPETFEAYVLGLTKATMPHYKATELYGSGMKAREAVLHLLMDVFQARETRSSLSTSAFKTALKWMGRHGVAFRPQVRELFVQMESASLPMDVEVFNILLAGNMRLDDLRNFGSIAYLMTRRGYVPTLKTWSLFLSIIKNNEVEQHVLRAMNECGLLEDPRASRMLATRFVMHDLQQARSNWSGISAFIASQNKKYGSGWVTTASFNNMLNELGRQGKLASCRDLLDQAQYWPSVRVGVKTINIMLNHAHIQRQPAAAAAALYRSYHHNIPLDSTSYHELFTLAFSLRKPNTMGLIWRLACIDRRETHEMRIRVAAIYEACPFLLGLPEADPPQQTPEEHGTPLSSLSTATATATPPKAQYANYAALPTFHEPEMLPALLSHATATAVDDLSHLPANAGSRIAYLFRQHYSRAGDWQPARPLHVLFAEALEADRELERRAADDAEPFDEGGPSRVEEEGIEIPLTARRREEEASQGQKAAPAPPAQSELYMTIVRRHISPSQRKEEKKRRMRLSTDKTGKKNPKASSKTAV
ncbi:hypothetical protein ACHAQH_000494 [Verticillium albo-atrum]